MRIGANESSGSDVSHAVWMSNGVGRSLMFTTVTTILYIQTNGSVKRLISVQTEAFHFLFEATTYDRIRIALRTKLVLFVLS